jgi:GNAT superfamily N-acetyltransferase
VRPETVVETKGTPAPVIREAEAGDVEACGAVIYEAFSGIAAQRGFDPDFPSLEFACQVAGFLIGHPSIYAIVAKDDGRVVGCNFLDERDPIRGVGPTAVAPGVQARGVGRLLTEAVIDRARDATGIRLCQDAHNPVSLSLYASLGFDVKEPLVIIGGLPAGAPPGELEVRPLAEDDLPSCEELYRHVHGVTRTNELTDALHGSMHEPFAAFREGRLVAYAASTSAWPVGHAVATTEEELRGLLLGTHAATGKPLSFLLPVRQASLFRWCLAEGLRVVKPVNLMALGAYEEPRGAWYPSIQY